jgi:hypothetical protein
MWATVAIVPQARNLGERRFSRSKIAVWQPESIQLFDYDHDEFLRTALVGQSKHEDTPFEICDWSVKEPFTGDWKKKARPDDCHLR